MTARPSNVNQIGDERVDAGIDRTPPAPGRQAIVLAALALGGLVLALQLWLLTIALELYLEGDGGQVWGVSLISGFVFAGGLGVLWLLSRRPQIWHSVRRRGR